MRLIIGLSALLLAAGTSNVLAAPQTFAVSFSGAQEVPGPGDPDGSAGGTITLDDTTSMVSWNFSYANIAAPTQMHIHIGAAGAQGGQIINLGVATTGGAGTLINTSTPALGPLVAVLADPAGHYVNIHNAAFPNGAVRGQLGLVAPAVSEWGLMGMAALLVVVGAVVVRRRFANSVRQAA